MYGLWSQRLDNLVASIPGTFLSLLCKAQHGAATLRGKGTQQTEQLRPTPVANVAPRKSSDPRNVEQALPPRLTLIGSRSQTIPSMYRWANCTEHTPGMT